MSWWAAVRWLFILVAASSIWKILVDRFTGGWWTLHVVQWTSLIAIAIIVTYRVKRNEQKLEKVVRELRLEQEHLLEVDAELEDMVRSGT